MTDFADFQRARDRARRLMDLEIVDAPRSRFTLDSALYWASCVFVAFSVGCAIGAVGAVVWEAMK